MHLLFLTVKAKKRRISPYDEGLTEMDSHTKENSADPNQNLEYTKTLQEPGSILAAVREIEPTLLPLTSSSEWSGHQRLDPREG